MAIITNGNQIRLSGNSAGYYTEDKDGKLVYHPTAYEVLQAENKKRWEEQQKQI